MNRRKSRLRRRAAPKSEELRAKAGRTSRRQCCRFRENRTSPLEPPASRRLPSPRFGASSVRRDRTAGVDDAVNLYHDFASGVCDDRPGLDSCLRALRKGDVLVVWKLDRRGRNLTHLVNTVQDLSARGVGLRVLAGDGAQIDTTTAAGRLVFGIFAALAEFERELIRERTVAGLKAGTGPRAQGWEEGIRLAGRGEKIHEKVCRCGGRVPIREVWRARRTTATTRTDLGVSGTPGTWGASNASNETRRS